MIKLKEDEVSLNFGPDGSAAQPREGIFRRDTRYLRQYQWKLGDSELLLSACKENRFHQHFARVGPDRSQILAFERVLTIRANGLDDIWTVTNTSMQPQDLCLELEIEGDFTDLFASMLVDTGDRASPVINRSASPGSLHLSSIAGDGVGMSVHIDIPGAEEQRWFGRLASGETMSVQAHVTLSADDDPSGVSMLPSYDDWRASFNRGSIPSPQRAALDQAIDDLRMLLLTTTHGPYPAAGMPWFVNIFGRDALIVAMMLLEPRPDIASAVLEYLAEHQGRIVDVFREEEPGKILHEVRRGELSRTNRIPFGRYYGSVDATPLFVIAVAMYADRIGDRSVISRLRPAWETAIKWLVAHQEVDGGLVAFAPSGSGLSVQSWKDSADSMNHLDGSPARAPLSVAEVQGYTFAAFTAAARFYTELGELDAAEAMAGRARRLQSEFHERFWIARLGTYAMALDADGRPLEVMSSDPGHLLWVGIVPVDIAPRLVETLMSPALWSGWGLRTLGTEERRYNAVSYHNGSVWPHDTALFAWGLHRYGFHREFTIVADALFDLAAAQPTGQLPELIAGTVREAGLPPTSYSHPCCPQAWAAASLPLMAELMTRDRHAT